MWSVSEIVPDVFFITRGWLSCNQFLARTPRLTLIDTAYKDDLETTSIIFESLGVRISDVKLIINTHCHCDHAGGNRYIQDQSNCQVWMHAEEKQRIDGRDDIGTWWRFHDTWADFFHVDRGLQEGEELSFGPLKLQVIYAPGHSRGQMALYCEEQRFLITADAMWQGDVGVLNPIVEGEDALERALKTLDRFTTLKVDTVFPGHGPAISRPGPIMRRCINRLERYLTQPRLMHEDHLRKMYAYIILTKGGVAQDSFFDYLMGSVWFSQLVDRYFGSDYRGVHEQTVRELLRMKMIKTTGDRFVGAAET